MANTTLWLHATVTLNGTAQQLSTLIAGTALGRLHGNVRMFSLQHDTGNSNPIYVGGPGVSSTDWGVYLEKPTSSVPAAPWKPADGEMPAGTLSLDGLYVIGTNNEKLHVLYVPLI